MKYGVEGGLWFFYVILGVFMKYLKELFFKKLIMYIVDKKYGVF